MHNPYNSEGTGAAALQRATDAAYPAAVSAMAQAVAEETGDRLYTFCASGQIFCVGGCRFAVDPVIRTPAVRDVCIGAARDLFGQLDAVFVTHRHEDHFDPDFSKALADLPCVWVFGHDFGEECIAASGLRPGQIRRVAPGEAFEIGGACVQVFEGRHFDAAGGGVPAVMYHITAGGKRVFLPADVRDYRASGLPAISPPDVMIANVWLGRDKALCVSEEAYAAFADYVAHFAPRRVLLGHLNEFARDAANMWTFAHAARVADRLHDRLPQVEVTPLRLFERYAL